MTDCVLALTTLPATADALAFADALVTAGLAACVTVLPAVESVYVWNGVVEHGREHQLVIKTTEARVAALWDAIRVGHPYDLPEFIVLPIAGGTDTYLDWIRTRTQTTDK